MLLANSFGSPEPRIPTYLRGTHLAQSPGDRPLAGIRQQNDLGAQQPPKGAAYYSLGRQPQAIICRPLRGSWNRLLEPAGLQRDLVQRLERLGYPVTLIIQDEAA
jgi:hypothetical protein